GSSVQELSAEFLQTLLDYDWPGNIRQLENLIRRYLILPEMPLQAADFLQTVPGKASSPSVETPVVVPTPPPPVRYSVPAEFSSLKEVGELAADRAQREVVLRMLDETNWNRKLAARRLNICYKALLNKIKKWQMRR